MIEEQDDGRLMLISWDMYGLESVIDVTEKQKSLLFDTLVSNENKFNTWLNRTMNYMMMRARANSHRRYEIYSIKVSQELDAECIADLFKTDPQMIVDLIRSRGTALYTDHHGHQNQVIF